MPLMRTLALVFVCLLLAAGPSFGCAPAPRAGDEVAIVEEAALIVWDPAAKTEHFIRRATFRGKGRDFGFLVPTPSVPALEEADDRIFEELEQWARPKTVYVTRRTIDWTPLLLSPMRREGMPTGAAAPVQVLSTQKLAGYEAAVLEASDAGALRQWLSGHGYAATDDLTEWLDVYVRQRWKITAFKIDATRPELAARTSAVKMSFTTERPFFPYREPASQRRLSSGTDTSRSLLVWFAGPERMRGTIGESTVWPGLLRRSDTLAGPLRAGVMRAAKLTLPASLRLSAFDDPSSIRPGLDDLFFTRSADQGVVVPPPNVIETVHRIPLPLDAVAFLAIVVAVISFRAMRRT